MAKFFMFAVSAGVVLGGLLISCAVEVQNTQPSKDLVKLATPPGSVYVGWRVFQSRCAGCHGPAAMGSSQAPDLLPLVRTMGSRQFVGLVLHRYDLGLPVGQVKAPAPLNEALVDDIVQQKAPPLTMPAWQGEPVVTASILDLFAYVSARAQGTQDAGRPAMP